MLEQHEHAEKERERENVKQENACCNLRQSEPKVLSAMLGQPLIGLTVRVSGAVQSLATGSGVTHRLEVHNEPDNEMLFMITAGQGRAGQGRVGRNRNRSTLFALGI